MKQEKSLVYARYAEKEKLTTGNLHVEYAEQRKMKGDVLNITNHHAQNIVKKVYAISVIILSRKDIRFAKNTIK